jgi:hypothetical protein
MTKKITKKAVKKITKKIVRKDKVRRVGVKTTQKKPTAKAQHPADIIDPTKYQRFIDGKCPEHNVTMHVQKDFTIEGFVRLKCPWRTCSFNVLSGTESAIYKKAVKG